MNQHSVQEAYLKTFAAASGRIWVYSKRAGRGRPKAKPAGQCAAEEDFQPKHLEDYQQQVIESAGIKALRRDGCLSDDEAEQIGMWMALHLIRTQKAREQLFESPADYERRFHQELWKEQQFAAYYPWAYTYSVAEPDFVITSDDPVVEFWCECFLIRACALNPQKIIFFMPRPQPFGHELPMHDFFNAMMWASPGDRLYSHRADLRIEQLAEFAREYHMQPKIEDMQFVVRGPPQA